MKSTAASLTLALLGTLSVSGCHQTAQRAASIASNLPGPSEQFEDYETRLSIAGQDENKGKTKAAKKAYETLAKENPTNPLVYHRLGIIAAGSGDFGTANRNFRRAFVLSSDDPELLADWGYSLFLEGKYEEAEALTLQSAELSPHDTRVANNLRLIYDNSSLTPSIGSQSIPLMPSEQQKIVVAGTLDSSFLDPQAEWQRPGDEESLHPFEEVTLPESTSEIAEAASLESLVFFEPIESAAEITPLDAVPLISESAFATIDEPANVSELNQLVAGQRTTSDPDSARTAGYEESFHPFEEVTLPEPTSEITEAASPEPLLFLEPLESAAEIAPLDAIPVISESAFATIDEPTDASDPNQPVAGERATSDADSAKTAGDDESFHPFEEVTLPKPTSEIAEAASPEPLLFLEPLESAAEIAPLDAIPAIPESAFATIDEPTDASDPNQPVAGERGTSDADSAKTVGDEESFHPFEEVMLPEPTSEIAEAASPEPLLFLEPLESAAEIAPLDAIPVISESAFATIDEPSDVSGLNQPVAGERAASDADSAKTAGYNELSIAPEHVRKLLTRARLELAAGDVEMSHAFAEAAADISIPLKVYQERPEKVLDEIEFVTGHNSVMSLENPAAATVEFTQVVPPAPAAYGDAPANNSSKKLTLDEAAALDPQGFRAIGRKSLSIRPKLVDSDGERRLLPERRAFRRLSQAPVVKHTVGYSRNWIPLSYSWEAPQLKYNPLYFEDPQLERYGNEVCILQPFLSGARFYATIPTVPYQMMSEGNSVCHTVYDFGYERPGDCVPYALEVPEFSWTGALASGGWAFALVVILP